MKKTAKKVKHIVKQNRHIMNNVMDKKLSKRMRMYLIITAIILCIESYELIISGYSLINSLLFFLGGIVLGFVVSRMFYLTWDTDEEVITSRIDTIGLIILIGYIIFSILRNIYLKEILHNTSTVLAVTFAMVGGMMIGRFVGLQYKAYKLFKKYG